MLEVARDTVTLGVGKRCAFGDIDGKLSFAARRVDALAAWSRRFRETLREIGGGDDRTVGDPRAMVRSFMPPSLGAHNPFSSRRKRRPRRDGRDPASVLSSSPVDPNAFCSSFSRRAPISAPFAGDSDRWIRSNYRFRSAVERFSQQPDLRRRCRRRSLTSIPAMTAITTAVPAPMIQGLPRSPPTPASAPPAAMNGRPQQSSDGSAQHASKSSPVTAATTGPARHSPRS